jgi:CBS domain-containing protein
MKKRTPVSKIMTANPVTVDVSTDLRAVNKLMTSKRIRHVPVVAHDKLVGVISHTDIMRLSFGSLFEGQGSADEAIFDMLTLEQVMVSNPKTVTSTTEIRDVAEFLTTAEFHALPVVDDGKLTGIVTTTDIIKYLIEQYG